MKTLRNSSIITLAIVALSLLVAAPVAYASTVTYTTTMSNASDNLTNETVLAAIYQFDNTISGLYAGQTLNSVTITFVGTGTTTLTATNSSPDTNSTGVQVLSDTTVTLNSSVSAIDNILVANDFSDDVTAHITGQTVNANTTSTWGPLTMHSAGGQSVLLTSGLGLFTGTSSLGFELNSSTTILGGGTDGSLTAGQEDNGSGGTVTVTYDYEPPPSGTPEPGTLSLFGTGLLGLAGMLRHKFAKSR
jgi:hypothetical protein